MNNTEKFLAGEVGLYPDISFEDYCKLKAVNASTLKLMEISPLHFHYYLTTGKPETDAMRLGKHVHAAIFEPKKFASDYIVQPEFTGLTKDGKESSRSADAQDKKKKWLEENKGKEYMSNEEKLEAEEIRDAIYSHSRAKQLLDIDSYDELTLVWDDEQTGLKCKGRVDRFIKVDGENTVLDLKTSSKYVTEKYFAKEVYDRKYYFSMAWYLRGMDAIYKAKKNEETKHHSAIIIAVETARPHGVLVYKLHDQWIYSGGMEIDRYLQEIKNCQDAGVWRGYSEQVQILDTTKWMFPED